MTAKDLFFCITKKRSLVVVLKGVGLNSTCEWGAIQLHRQSPVVFFVLFYMFIFLTGMVLKSHDLYQSVEYRNRITFCKDHDT